MDETSSVFLSGIIEKQYSLLLTHKRYKCVLSQTMIRFTKFTEKINIYHIKEVNYENKFHNVLSDDNLMS